MHYELYELNNMKNLVESRCFHKILGSRPETAWRAWRCRQVTHQFSPNCWVLWHELPGGETKPLGDAWCFRYFFYALWKLWYV